MGTPKGLLRLADGTPFVAHAARVLAAGGAARVLVVVGARGDDVSPLVPRDLGCPVEVVTAADWAEGMGASLRTGLRALDHHAEAAVVTLVDTPGVTATAVGRLVALGAPGALARCAYDGVPGHPVLLGRDHWPGVVETAIGDAGARAYLRGRAVTLVEAADVADGADVDTREQYVRWGRDR